MKKCIIGKNSKIVGQISGELEGFDFLSHKTFASASLNQYTHIYLFSWSYISQEENFKILKSIPPEKLIFVSSVAVYANAVKRQWNKYPRMKLEAEKKVIEMGGKVVRLGICNKKLLLRHKGKIPYTDLSLIVRFLNLQSPAQVTNLFALESGSIKSSSFLGKVSSIVNTISDFLPSQFMFQAPLEIFLKILGSADYGYTNNACRFFGKSLQIGFGALGYHYWKLNKSKEDDVLLVSPRNDLVLNADGFREFRIGKKYTGLSKFWHGVSIVKRRGFEQKSVPFVVRRPKLPHYALAIEAESYCFSDGVFKTQLDCCVLHLEVFSEQLILAAGAIENCRIINTTVNKIVTFTDHETGFIGTVDCNQIIRGKYLKKCGPFLMGRNIFSYHDHLAFMIDFRPLSSKSIKSRSNIYNNSASGVVFKLLTRFSAGQINEAIFNKFGIAFATKKLAIFVQLEVKDCIVMSPAGVLSRTRANQDEIEKLLCEVKQVFPSFVAATKLYLHDGIHVTGGKDLIDDDSLKKLVCSNKLIILGSPTNRALGPFHNTQELVDEIISDNSDYR